MSLITVKTFRSLRELDALQSSIEALNLESRRPCAFSTLSYLEAFLAHDEFGATERELLFLTVFEGDRLIGYLPLRKHGMRSLGWLPWVRIGVLISHDTDRPHVIARPHDEARCAQALYRHLLDHERGWSLVELGFQDAPSALLDVPPVNPLRYWARRFDSMPISTMAVAWGSVPEYLAALTTSQRKNLTRALRRTLGAGRIEAVSSSDPSAVKLLLELYLSIERRSWKQAARVGIGRDPRRVAFFKALTQPRQPMQLAVHLLMLDDLPVSGAVTGAFDGVLHGLEVCFDQDYEDLSCGHVGTLLSIRYAIATGIHEFNMNGNYAYNKALFGGVATSTSAVQLYRVGGLPWLKAQAGLLKRRLRPPVATPPTFNPKRRAHEQHAEVRPVHQALRQEARATFAQLEADGAKLERLAGAALELALLPKGSTPRKDLSRAREQETVS